MFVAQTSGYTTNERGDKIMKKFTAILVFAVLALGCVFAASGDVVVLEATMEEVIPLYKIYGDSTVGIQGITSDALVASTEDGVVKKNVTSDETSVSLGIVVKELGYKESEKAEKNYIRYKGNFTVKVTADVLKNVDYLSGTDAKKTEQGALATLTNGDVSIKWTATADHTFGINSVNTNEVVFNTNFLTGKKVSPEGATTAGWDIVSWTWKWDTTTLIGGETYRADIKIEYTVE